MPPALWVLQRRTLVGTGVRQPGGGALMHPMRAHARAHTRPQTYARTCALTLAIMKRYLIINLFWVCGIFVHFFHHLKDIWLTRYKSILTKPDQVSPPNRSAGQAQGPIKSARPSTAAVHHKHTPRFDGNSKQINKKNQADGA